MAKRRTVTVVPYEWEQFNDNAPPNDLEGFVCWITDIANAIPEECRATATIDITSYTEYDSSYASVRVQYWRDETDEEMAQRLERDKAGAALKAQLTRESELNTLAQLLAKYGPAGAKP